MITIKTRTINWKYAPIIRYGRMDSPKYLFSENGIEVGSIFVPPFKEIKAYLHNEAFEIQERRKKHLDNIWFPSKTTRYVNIFNDHTKGYLAHISKISNSSRRCTITTKDQQNFFFQIEYPKNLSQKSEYHLSLVEEVSGELIMICTNPQYTKANLFIQHKPIQQLS
jgi:hypothetical protein